MTTNNTDMNRLYDKIELMGSRIDAKFDSLQKTVNESNLKLSERLAAGTEKFTANDKAHTHIWWFNGIILVGLLGTAWMAIQKLFIG